jgi:DNA-binding GntR family transcriptional regulator
MSAMLITNQLRYWSELPKTDNPEAANILDRGWELVIAIRNRFGGNRIAEIVHQHRRLVAAIWDGDVARAVEAARTHCESAKTDLLLRMEQDGAA